MTVILIQYYPSMIINYRDNIGYGKKFPPIVERCRSIARVFDRMATHVFERCVQTFEPNRWHLFEA